MALAAIASPRVCVVNPIRRLYRYGRPHRRLFLGAAAAMTFYAAASGALAYLFKPIFDDVLPDRTGFAPVVSAIIGLGVCKGIAAYFSAYLMTDVGQRLVRDLRSDLFGHVLKQSAGFFARRTTGGLMSRIMHDVARIQQAVAETLGDLLRESVTLLAYAGLLLYYDAGLALVCMTGAPIVVYPLARLGQRVRRATRRGQEELERLSHITAEAFSGHRIVKAFAGEPYERKRFDRAADRLYRTNMKITSSVSALPPLMEWLGTFGIVGVLWYGSRQIAAGDLTTGEFTSFVAAMLLTYGPVKKLSRVNANVQQALAAAERVFETLDTRSEAADRPGAKPLAPLARSIEFRDVSFTYGDGAGGNVLDRVSFEVEAGQVVAIVGLSGAGKTTLVNLVPRFYDVTAGAITMDGVDVRDVTIGSLRSQIGIVTQDTVLFDDTIGNNIAYALPSATRELVEAAARAAHAHEFIETLPGGYDALIGERGQRLSGGQRQRLAIARALLRNSPILILDEATSSLDAESELLVQDALAKLVLNRTAFVIAHRLSTVRRADRIVVLDRGRVREIGRHEELLAAPDSLYAKLYSLQFFDRSGVDGAAPAADDALPAPEYGVGRAASEPDRAAG